MKIAVIDFSSTSISLLVEEVSGEMMTPVVGLRRSVSILGYMSKKGRLSERGVEKAVESIRYLIDAASKVGAQSVHLISTASMRRMRNYGEVMEAVRAATGLPIKNLSGQDEAYADYLANREYAALGSTLLLDIGGYSAAIADLDDGRREGMAALNIGPAALFPIYDGTYPSKEDAKKLRKVIRKAYVRNGVYPERRYSHMVLTGSNAAALYSVYADFYSIADTSFRTMERKKLRKMVKHLIASEGRTVILIRNAPEKVHTLLPAAILAEESAAIYGADELIVSDRGVKEGYLRFILEEGNV